MLKRKSRKEVPLPVARYATARGLLTELRDLARELPGGLDERGIGEELLAKVCAQAGCSRAALYWLTPHSLELVAVAGMRRADWSPEQSDTRWGTAIDDAQIAVGTGTLLGDASGVGAVLPLIIDGQVVGVLGIERDAGDWSDTALAALSEQLGDAAVRLDAARLFSEVRALATIEERRRLSREIHDGITQDVTGLAWQLEEAVDALPEDVQAVMDPVVATVDRIQQDLRENVFELRADIDADTDLLTALDNHVHHAMLNTGTVVHMTKSGSGQRLNPDVEVEAFRIAQEAIANVRKHSGARNVWVDVRVQPPGLLLRVADDGSGRVADIRPDSFGLSIMRERAERIGAGLVLRDKVGGGTLVELTIA
ncbi:MAG: histidine kinase [Candidatus Nanopelagicales bacterium]|jgi:signal transduction histidine kinase